MATLYDKEKSEEMSAEESSVGSLLEESTGSAGGGEEPKKVTFVSANNVEISTGQASVEEIGYESFESGKTCDSNHFDELLKDEITEKRAPIQVGQQLLHVRNAGLHPVEPEEPEEAKPWRVVRQMPAPVSEEDQQSVKEAITGAMDKYFQQACKEKLVLKLKILHTPDGNLQVEVSASSNKKKQQQ